MKSSRVLATITGGSGMLVIASGGVFAVLWPHIAGTILETTHAITYACQAALADLSRTQLFFTLAGSIAFMALLGWLGITCWRFLRAQHSVRSALLPVPVGVLSLAADAGLDPSRLSIVQADRAFAMTMGFRWPEVVISHAAMHMLSRAELKAVLEHEAHHVRQREPLRRLLLSMALLWVPFGALRKRLQASYIAASEIEADAHVTDQHVLGSALLRLVTPPIPAAGFSPLDARVERLVNPAYRHSGRLALQYVAIVAMVVGIVMSIVPRGVSAVYGTHLSARTETHLMLCRAEHERMLQSRAASCGPLSTPQTCTSN